MANEDYVNLLKQGNAGWNKWRDEGNRAWRLRAEFCPELAVAGHTASNPCSPPCSSSPRQRLRPSVYEQRGEFAAAVELRRTIKVLGRRTG